MMKNSLPMLCILVLAMLLGLIQCQLCNIKVFDDTKENTLLSDLNTFDRYSSVNNPNKKFNLLSNAKVNGLFRLEKTGKLFSAKPIDREHLCKSTESCCDNKDPCTIHLSIAVTSDSFIEPRMFECGVQVIDVNDHTPQFLKDKITISIKENENVGSTFPLPFAIDIDSDKYSVRDYKLEEKSTFPPTFSLEQHRPSPSLNLQLIQKLDREKRASYELILLAFDRGSPPKTGRLIININIIDVNDNPPQLLRTNYIVSVEESKFSTQPLLTIEAKDDDENENAQLVFKIIDDNPLKNDAIKYFRIEQNTGKIFLNQQLDFEKEENHRFFVEVSNGVSHVETATATVLVKVENLNDEKPEILIDYLDNDNNNNNAVIKENDMKVRFVAIATVNDKDKGPGGQVQCRLMNFIDVFEIQNKGMPTTPIKYHVMTKVSLDRENVAYYEIQMECEDKGNPVLKAKAHIKVNVEDVNDNTPVIKIDNNMKIMIKENQSPGTLVTKISATDADEGRNSELVYSISSYDDQTRKYLEINAQTGELRTIVKIDREREHGPLISLPVILTVTDKGEIRLSTTREFFVFIEDENDNAPEFGNDVIRFSVTENQPARYTLGEIPVTDRDDMSNLKVSLAHSPNEMSSPFILFSKDNKYFLNTTRSLDWEKEQNFTLRVIASDGKGFKSNTVTASVLITVIDENDHAPVIIFPQQNNSAIHKISYMEKAEFTVLTVSAVDKDSPESQNGKFNFQLFSDKDLFNINFNSGRITTSRIMTRQDIGKYTIRVLVRDQGNPSKESSIQLIIEVDETKSSSRVYNEDEKDVMDSNKKYTASYLLSKESFLITSLIILLIFLLLCIFMILYMRHIRGLFPMLPDIFEGCTCFQDKRTKSKKNAPYHKSMCDIPVHESRNFSSRSSPLDFHQQIVRNNDNGLIPFYLNQYDSSVSTAHGAALDHKQQLPVSQFRQYETMKYQHYSPPVFNSKTSPNYNYDQLFYHHPSITPCDDSFMIPTVSSHNTNNVYDARCKTIPTNVPRDLNCCQRIINNIESSPLIVDDEQRKDHFASNPCLKSEQSENFAAEPTATKTPDIRRHVNKKHDKIDTYAVTYPKEQSTFV